MEHDASVSPNPMAISTIAPSGCDTIQPPTRFYASQSISLRSAPESHHHLDSDSNNDPTLSSDVSGLHRASAILATPRRQDKDGEDDVMQDVVVERSSKAKGKAKATEEWLQPPGRKLCSRHLKMADGGTNLLLQQTLDDLPLADRETVSNIWSSFSSSSHARRGLILQGLLTMCCQSELFLLSDQLSQINRVDPFSLLPRELALKILGLVDAKSLTRAAQVSRHWKSLADDDILWKKMCEQHIEKKCRKCGWGLPLLEPRVSASGPSSPVGAGATSSGVGYKRSAMQAGHVNGDRTPDHRRPLKRARSDPPYQPNYATASVPSPRPVVLPRIPSSSPLLHPQQQHQPTSSSSSDSNSVPLSYDTSTLARNHLTRPWKDVYSERLTIARNWRLGRATETVLKGHTDGVMCLQFNDKLQYPSFPILISGSYDRTVRVWNMQTGQEMLQLRGHIGAVRALQFDECKLVTGSMDRTLRLWNWRTGQCIRTLEGHTAGVVCLAFDSNILVSGSVDKTVKVWNFRTGDCFTLRGHMDWVNSVKIWDRFASIPSVDEDDMTPGTAPATPNALDPGKMLFSASDDKTIRLWDLSTRTCVRQFEGHVGQVQSIQLSMADDEEVLGEGREEVTVEEEVAKVALADTKKAAAGRLSPILSSSSTPILISGSLDNTIRIWDIETGKAVKTLFGHIEGVWAVASDMLRLVSGSHDKTIKIWNRGEGKCTATIVGHRGAVTSLAIGDDKIVSGSDDGDVRIWRFGAGAPPSPLPTPSTTPSTSSTAS